MTVTEDSDIYRDVMHLLKLGLFDEVHWQLNVVWCNPWNVREWAERVYLPGIKQLVKLFLEKLFEGKVLRIIPIIGVINAVLFKPFNYIPCGSGKYSFTINTDGRVLACPIAVREDWATVGNLDLGIVKTFELPEKCRYCSYVRYCGGRCLYMHMENIWPKELIDDVCYVTRKFIDIVLKIVPEVKRALSLGIIREVDLKHNPLEDSTEVIP